MSTQRNPGPRSSSNENDILHARPAGPRRRDSGQRERKRKSARASLVPATYVTVLRWLFCATALVMALGSALVFEASRTATNALAAAHAALRDDDQNARVGQLLAAAQIIDNSWARPAAWHAGAQEALSWTYAALDAQTPESDFRARAIVNAERAVFRAPIQPAPWARLAAYDLEGDRNNLCDVRDCLAHSWAAVEMAPLATYCTRLRLSHELGLVGGADDPRALALTRVNVPPDALAQCLDYLPRDALLHVLLEQQLQSAARMQIARETGVSPHTRPYE